MTTIEITPEQVTDLARPFVGMVDAIVEFYKDPKNQQAYREWYLKKYGHEPDEV